MPRDSSFSSVLYALEYSGATLRTYQKINEGGEHMWAVTRRISQCSGEVHVFSW